MNLLSRAAILAAVDFPRETVPVPEWGGDILMQGCSAHDRDAFEISISFEKFKDRAVHMNDFRARLVQKCAITEAGERLFGEADIPLLSKKSAIALGRLFDVAKRLSGLSKEDVDELTKNSDGGQSDGSTST